MTEVTIKVAPAYNLHARTDIMKLDEVMERFDSDVEEYRHFGLFWMPTDQSARLYNLDGAGADDCVVKRYREFGVDDDPPELGPHERFGPAYRIYPMVYDPNFHEVEYFLPLEHAREILEEMRRLMMRWLPLSVYPLEIRVVAEDEAWMSPNYQRDNLVVSISGEPGQEYWPYLHACDSFFAEYRGRPALGQASFHDGRSGGAPLPPLPGLRRSPATPGPVRRVPECPYPGIVRVAVATALIRGIPSSFANALVRHGHPRLNPAIARQQHNEYRARLSGAGYAIDRGSGRRVMPGLRVHRGRCSHHRIGCGDNPTRSALTASRDAPGCKRGSRRTRH